MTAEASPESTASTGPTGRPATSTGRIRVLWNASAGFKGGISTNRTGEAELREPLGDAVAAAGPAQRAGAGRSRPPAPPLLQVEGAS